MVGMKYCIETYPNTLACQDAVVNHAHQAAEMGRRPVLICPNYTSQLAAQTWLAQRGAGFGITVTTLFSWVRDLWALFGDGSEFVMGEYRAVSLARLLLGDEHLQYCAGIFNVLNACAKNALAFIEQGENLTESEEQVLALLRVYREQLRESNRIEYCEALLRLAGCAEGFHYAPLVFGMREDELGFAERRFLDACGSCLLINEQSEVAPVNRNAELLKVQNLLYKPRFDCDCAQAEGAVCCALASGPAANRRIVLQAVEQALNKGCESVVVAAADPISAFDFASPQLAKKGVSCGLSASMKLVDTDMGRAFFEISQLIDADRDDPNEADPFVSADFSHNPFSAISWRNAMYLDKTHRKNRLMGQGEMLTGLANHADDDFMGFVGKLEEGDYSTAIELMQKYLDRRYSSNPAYHAQQSRVLLRIQCICDEAPDLPLSVLIDLIGSSTIVVSVEQAENPQVRFCSQKQVADLEPGSIDCVVLADLNSENLPVKLAEDSLSTLLRKLGVAVQVDPLVRVRSMFYAAFEAARICVYVQRTLNTDTGKPAQAASIFEELMDCYKPDPRSDEGMEAVLGIPEVLVPYSLKLGEEDVLANLGAQKRMLTSQVLPQLGELSEESRKMIVLPRIYGKRIVEGLNLSASQIESYLECPYGWFAKRRLRLEALDEGFSALERGTFLHAVMCKFYERFKNEVAARVNPENVETARLIMEETFEAVCARQLEKTYKDGRYVPKTEWEEKERHSILPKLCDYLDKEAVLLPGFVPYKFEWQFGGENPVSYAGCNLNGTIDRIDVDEYNHAVVIDYKSSISASYRLHNFEKGEAPESFTLPPKIQALLYAKVVQDLLGYEVVGALYVNPLKQEIVGAYDAHYLGVQDIPFQRNAEAESSIVPYEHAESMGELLDKTEGAIAQRMQELAEGLIPPMPLNDEVCTYCPVSVCDKRPEKKGF